MVQLITKTFTAEELQDAYNITSKFPIQVVGSAGKIDGITRQMIARVVFGSSVQRYVQTVTHVIPKEIEERVYSMAEDKAIFGFRRRDASEFFKREGRADNRSDSRSRGFNSKIGPGCAVSISAIK